MKKSHALERHGEVRSPALRVFEPVAGVPATRGDCVDGERPCPRIQCRAHLWAIAGPDRAGRRWEGRAPGDTLRAGWLEDPMPPSCALDVADRVRDHGGEITVEQVAEILGLRPSRLAAVLASALAKLKAAGVTAFEG